MSTETKALFFDVDGTLIDWMHGIFEVPAGAVREMRRIQEQGHKLFISSGRPLPFIGPEFASLGFDGYVLLNGAEVLLGGETVYEERMGGQVARTVARLHEEAGAGYAIDTAHHVYVDASFGDVHGFLGIHAPHLTSEFNREVALERALKIESCPTREQRDYIAAGVARLLPGAVKCDDNGTGGTFELYSPRLSKASGIMCVLDALGISLANTYAFGDGLNDLEMIRLCGTGVAMGNAVHELKAEADYVCGTVVEHGLEQALHELF